MKSCCGPIPLDCGTAARILVDGLGGRRPWNFRLGLGLCLGPICALNRSRNLECPARTSLDPYDGPNCLRGLLKSPPSAQHHLSQLGLCPPRPSIPLAGSSIGPGSCGVFNIINPVRIAHVVLLGSWRSDWEFLKGKIVSKKITSLLTKISSISASYNFHPFCPNGYPTKTRRLLQDVNLSLGRILAEHKLPNTLIWS